MVPDYYAILGVDPAADRATIEAALARKQPAWSSGTRNPKTKHTYQSYLDQIPSIRQTLLGDPATRAAYDAEREAEQRADRDRRLDELQRRIRLRAAKGGLSLSDRSLLRDETNRLGLALDDLERLIEPIPPIPESPRTEADVEDEPADVLDAVMRRQLRISLDHLGKIDLYEALGLPRDAPAREIALRADGERQRWMRKSQVTAEKTAWLEVITLAQSHLTSPVARARYDRTLAWEAEERLADSIAFALKGLDSLDAGTRHALEVEATAQGILPDRARALIDRACRRQGIDRSNGATPASPSPAANGATRWIRCRSCGGVTDFTRVVLEGPGAACLHCGASLRWGCPVCRRSRWVDEGRCNCGFRLSWRQPFVQHFEAAQRAFRARDYGASLTHLRRAQDFAPEHVGSRKGVEKIRERLSEIERVRSGFELAFSGRRILEARKSVAQWGRLVDPSDEDLRNARARVQKILREATHQLARARSLERSNPAMARDLYRKCLGLVSDSAEARAGLERCPPDPPSELSAEFVHDRVVLRWSPPAPDGNGPVTYAILRRGATPFRHPTDGARIGESDAPTFEDTGVVAGTSVAYAVLTRRGDVESVGAVSVGPIFLVGEVRDVRIDTRAREIDLAWTPPRGAFDTRVVRKRGAAPTGPLDGDRVESLLDQAHDTSLETDKVYHYGIFAIYRTADGKMVASRGVFVSAQPHTPVATIQAPLLSTTADGRLQIAWNEPPRGQVKILRAPRPFPHPPGTRLGPAQVAELTGDWLAVSGHDHAFDTPPPLGCCYYTPLNSWGGTATVGHSATLTRVADPVELRATRLGDGRVQLRWKWGPIGDQTLIVARPGADPTGPDDPAAQVWTVFETDYARAGSYVLTLPSHDSGPWHFAAHALATLDGCTVHSGGIEPSARTVLPGASAEVAISYAFRRRWFPRRSWSVVFRTEPKGAALPATVVVGHPRALPLSADDGEVVAHLPAASDGARFELPGGGKPARLRLRVFPDPSANPETLVPTRFIHPDSGATRV